MDVVGELRDKILAQLADPDSRRMIISTRRAPKTALALRDELGLPTSTVYRKIVELRECSLLMVEKMVEREDGKKEASYACAFTKITLSWGKEGIELELSPSEQALERRWFELFFKKPASEPR